MAHAQYVRSCGKVSPLSSQGATPLTDDEGRPYIGTASLQFIPSLCVSERYDTNVFYAPKTPGLQRDDFVTDVNPQVRVNHNGDYVTGYLDVGGFYETYVRNSDLNFFGTADTLYLNLDKSIKRLLPNASLSVTDYVRYTPTPPGFSNLVAGTSPGSPVNVQNVYAQGILSYRANNVTNSANVLTSYKITPVTSLNASYSNMILRFLSSPVLLGRVARYDRSNWNSGSNNSGNRTRYTKCQLFSYAVRIFFCVASSSVPSSVFITNTATLGWSRILTPYLKAQAGGGIIVIDPGITTYALNASITSILKTILQRLAMHAQPTRAL